MKVSQLKYLDKALAMVLGWLPRKKPLSPKTQAIPLIKLSAMGDAFCLIRGTAVCLSRQSMESVLDVVRHEITPAEGEVSALEMAA